MDLTFIRKSENRKFSNSLTQTNAGSRNAKARERIPVSVRNGPFRPEHKQCIPGAAFAYRFCKSYALRRDPARSFAYVFQA